MKNIIGKSASGVIGASLGDGAMEYVDFVLRPPFRLFVTFLSEIRQHIYILLLQASFFFLNNGLARNAWESMKICMCALLCKGVYLSKATSDTKTRVQRYRKRSFIFATQLTARILEEEPNNVRPA